jgi:hypothetical protein
MPDLIIGTPLADELREIAEHEHQTVEELLTLLISHYKFLTDADEEDAELNAVLRERYARMRGGSEADEIVMGDDQTAAKIRASAASFRKRSRHESS